MSSDPYYGTYGSGATPKTATNSTSSPNSKPSAQTLVAIQKDEQSRAAPGETVVIHSTPGGRIWKETIHAPASGGGVTAEPYAPYSSLEPNLSTSSGPAYAAPPVIKEKTSSSLDPNLSTEKGPAFAMAPTTAQKTEAAAKAEKLRAAAIRANPNPTPKPMLSQDFKPTDLSGPVGLDISGKIGIPSREQAAAAGPLAAFGIGAVRGTVGIADLGIEAIMNPSRAAGILAQSLNPLNMAQSAASDPFAFAGEMVGSATVFKIVPGVKGGVAKETPKIEMAKIDVPTSLEITRTGIISAGETPFISSSKIANFGRTKEFVISQPIVEVRPFTEGSFTRITEVTKLQETPLRLGGSIETIESAGKATVTQGAIKGQTIPGEPMGNLLGLGRSVRGELTPETIIFEKPKPSILSGKNELVPASMKPLSTESAVMAGLDDLSVTLFPKERATIGLETISKGTEAKTSAISLNDENLKNAGLSFKETMRIDITPRILQEAPKIYDPRYFSREPRGFDFKPSTKALGGIKLPPATMKVLGVYYPKLGGKTPFDLAITGQTLIGKSPGFKRFKSFSETPKGESTPSTVDVGLSGGMRAKQIVKQIYKSRSKQIPLADVQAKTIIRTAQPSLIEDILLRQAAFRRGKTRQASEFGFEVVAVPKGTEISNQRNAFGFIPIQVLRPEITQINAESISPAYETVNIQKTQPTEKLMPVLAFTSVFKYADASAQVQAPKTAQITAVKYADSTTQRTAEIQKPVTLTVPALGYGYGKPPEIPRKPKFGDFNQEEKEKKKRKIGKPGFDVFFRRFGEWKKISGAAMTEGEAMSLGEITAKTTLGASYKLRPAGQILKEGPQGGGTNPNEFYQKIEKGEKLFIQRPKFRLSSRKEIEEIQGAKRAKAGLFKLF